MNNLTRTIAERLRAGALVLIVKDSDENLALSQVEAAVAACSPVRVLSVADDNTMSALEEHASGSGTLVLRDFLSVYGTNPIGLRFVRQVALQQRDDSYARLVLIERADIEVPAAIAGDVEVVEVPLPSVEELAAELDAFLEAQNGDVALAENGETRYAVAAAGAGLARHEFSRLLARSVIEQDKLDAAWIRQEKARRVSARLAGALTFESVDAADVGGLDNLTAWLRERRAAFSSQRARDFGLPEPKGLLIVGVPGNGKSLTAKAVARMWGLPLLRLDAGRLFGSLVGQSESQARAAIEAAEACAPCVLWIDEVEKALAGGASGSSTDSGTTQRVFGTILTWLQEKRSPVFVVATANRVEALPPELLRKGRFDEIFAVGLPTRTERAAIANIHLARRNRDLGADAPDAVAKASEGYVGAEIEQAVIDGLFSAFAAERDLNLDDVLGAISATTPLSRTAPEDIKRIQAWSEGRARPASPPEAPKKAVRRPASRVVLGSVDQKGDN